MTFWLHDLVTCDCNVRPQNKARCHECPVQDYTLHKP